MNFFKKLYTNYINKEVKKIDAIVNDCATDALFKEYLTAVQISVENFKNKEDLRSFFVVTSAALRGCHRPDPKITNSFTHTVVKDIVKGIMYAKILEILDKKP